MKLKVSAAVGGAVGVATAIAAAGVAYERHQVNQDRARIDPRSAAVLGALPVDREYVVITEDSLDLHVEEAGPVDAPLTVIFVHGFTLNLASFQFQRAAISAQFGSAVRMVFYDQRSHGRSARSPSGDCTIAQLGRDLAAVIERAAPSGPIVLVGHSMGGMTLMSLADQCPELFRSNGDSPARVKAIVFINTSSGNMRTVTLGLPAVMARLRGPVMPMVLRGVVRNAALVEKTRALGKDLAWLITKRLSFASADVDPAVVAFATNMISATPVDVVAAFYSTLMEHDGNLGLMNLVNVPAVVIGASEDALTPLSHAEAIAAALPRAELITVSHAGHLLMLEHPELVNEPLLRVVATVLATLRAPARRVMHTRRSARPPQSGTRGASHRAEP